MESASDQAEDPPEKRDSCPEVPGQQMLTGQYGTAQMNDPALTNSLRHVRVVEGVCTSDQPLVYPHFAVKNGLLYQIKKEGRRFLNNYLYPKLTEPRCCNLLILTY